jgi:hypothetical protein
VEKALFFGFGGSLLLRGGRARLFKAGVVLTIDAFGEIGGRAKTTLDGSEGSDAAGEEGGGGKSQHKHKPGGGYFHKFLQTGLGGWFGS